MLEVILAAAVLAAWWLFLRLVRRGRHVGVVHVTFRADVAKMRAVAERCEEWAKAFRQMGVSARRANEAMVEFHRQWANVQAVTVKKAGPHD